MTSRFVEEENIDQVNERIDHMLSAYEDEDENEYDMMDAPNVPSASSRVAPPPPEFDLSKIVGAFSTMFRPVQEIPRPKPKTYISKVFDILLANVLLIIHFLLPDDMVSPAEKFVKDRLVRVVEKRIDGMKLNHKTTYHLLLLACAVLYHMYRFRLLVAFASGFCWGVYLI